jgi:hypothetical protein
MRGDFGGRLEVIGFQRGSGTRERLALAVVVGKAPGGLAFCKFGAVSNDEVSRKEFLDGLGSAVFKLRSNDFHRFPDQLANRLQVGCQADGGPSSHGDIVKADDGNIATWLQPKFPGDIQRRNGHEIIGAKDPIRSGAVALQKPIGGGHGFLKGVIAYLA